MDFLKKPIFAYVGMVLAVIAVVLGVIKPEWASIAWMIAGVLGFGSFDLLRSFIDSKGWKTHAIFVVVGLGALAQIFGLIKTRSPRETNFWIPPSLSSRSPTLRGSSVFIIATVIACIPPMV